MALDQPGLFDEGEMPEEIRITLDDGPLARPARVGFLAGMLALWVYDGKPTPVVRELDDTERSPEVGRMFRVRFEDGVEAEAFEDELQEEGNG